MGPDAALVPASGFELGVQPTADDSSNEFIAEHVGGQAEDIGVVVPAGHLGGQFVMAERGPDAGDLVGADRHTDSAATYENGDIGLAVDDTACGGEGEVRVVAAPRAVSAHVQNLVALLAEKYGNLFLYGMATMIGS